MNILFIKRFFVGCIVSEIPRVSVFGYSRYEDLKQPYKVYIYVVVSVLKI